MIIECDMHLHNYLVDYRDAQTNYLEEEISIETIIFKNYFTDRGIQPIVVGNDGGRSSGRPSATDTFYKMQGLKETNYVHQLSIMLCIVLEKKNWKQILTHML